jgi:hypothetical protein
VSEELFRYAPAKRSHCPLCPPHCLSHCLSHCVSLTVSLTVSPSLCLSLCPPHCVSLTVPLTVPPSLSPSLCLPHYASHCAPLTVPLPLTRVAPTRHPSSWTVYEAEHTGSHGEPEATTAGSETQAPRSAEQDRTRCENPY